jgi:hypothetical protein
MLQGPLLLVLLLVLLLLLLPRQQRPSSQPWLRPTRTRLFQLRWCLLH